MSGLFGSKPSVQPPSYTGLQIQTSAQGLGISIVYGQTKAAPNLLDNFDFTAVRHDQSVGGKGGGTTVTSYTYTVGAILGIGEGTVSAYGKVWSGTGNTTTAHLGLTEFYGTSNQSSWGYMVSAHPTRALPYKNTAYLAGSALDLGNSAMLPQLWFEVMGILHATNSTGTDAEPSQVVSDFLSNPTYGAQFNSAKIDSVTLTSANSSFKNYCGALGLGFSVCIKDQKPARTHLTDWFQVTDTAPVWSGNVLKIIPYWDTNVSAHGYTYVPDVAVRYALTEDDFRADPGEEPITISRKDVLDRHNQWQMQINDRAQDYNVTSVESKDQASIEAIGLRPASAITADCLADLTMASLCVELVKNRDLFVPNTYKFRLSWEYVLLEPMDIVTLTLPSMHLSAQPVRITAIEEDEAGLLTVTADEYYPGTNWVSTYNQQASLGTIPVSAYTNPSNSSVPLIFEPPAVLCAPGTAEVWLAATGTLVSWGGAEVYVSLDGGTSYTDVGMMGAQCRVGTLTANLATYGGANPDNSHTLAVDITTSAGTLPSGTANDAAAGRLLCYADGELISYANSSLTSTGHYSLTTLYRGMYNSAIGAHNSGTQFCRLDNALFRYTIPDTSYIGQTIYIKLASTNPLGALTQDPATVTPYTYTINGTGFQGSAVIPCYFANNPAAGQTIVNASAIYPFNIPAGLSGAVASVGTNPTSTANFTLAKNGANFATVSFNTGGSPTIVANASSSFAVSDVLTVVGPVVHDATVAKISLTIAVTESTVYGGRTPVAFGPV